MYSLGGKSVIEETGGQERLRTWSLARFAAYNRTAAEQRCGNSAGHFRRKGYLHFQYGLGSDRILGLKQDSGAANVDGKSASPRNRATLPIAEGSPDRETGGSDGDLVRIAPAPRFGIDVLG